MKDMVVYIDKLGEPKQLIGHLADGTPAAQNQTEDVAFWATEDRKFNFIYPHNLKCLKDIVGHTYAELMSEIESDLLMVVALHMDAYIHYQLQNKQYVGKVGRQEFRVELSQSGGTLWFMEKVPMSSAELHEMKRKRGDFNGKDD